jgi:transcriptional regulator with XRE-family HTH domain
MSRKNIVTTNFWRDFMPTPLGERINQLRKKFGFTLEALAQKIDSSKSYIWELENKDVTRPSAEKLQKIAMALNTTTEYFLGEDEVNEFTAEDNAFFRKYRKMSPEAKEKIRQNLDTLWEDED